MPKKQTAKIMPSLAGSPEAQPKQTLRAARSGETYVYESDEWRLDRAFKIDWSDLRHHCMENKIAPVLLDSFRRVMHELVQEVSGSYAKRVFEMVVSMLKHCEDEVSIESFEHWRATVMERNISSDYKNECLGTCRAGLIAWSDGKYPGLAKGLLDHINGINLGYTKSGRAVRELCPVRGPLTQAEEAALIRWLHEAYADQVVTMQAYAILLLLVEFGCRPVEIAALRAGDVIDAEANQAWRLAIPNAKGGRNYRASFRVLELPADLYALLKGVIANNQANVAEAWGQAISPELSKKLPLFAGRKLISAGSRQAFEHRISNVPSGYDIFTWNYVKTSLQRCPVRTDRLNGDLLPLSLYRFRRTVATRLAEAGANDELIAAVLGHGSLTTVQVYTAHTYADQEACDAIMIEAWKPVIDRVADRLLESPIPGQATIHVTRDDGVGNCSQLCGAGILTCYLCPKFRPFVDAQHDKALAQVESVRQSRIDRGMRGQEVDSLDQSIGAIKATIQVCHDYKKRGAGHV